jgi:hypothetical protein
MKAAQQQLLAPLVGLEFTFLANVDRLAKAMSEGDRIK